MTEKPIECVGCCKKATLIYKEISKNSICSYVICKQCPKIENLSPENIEDTFSSTLRESLSCPSCHTNLKEISRSLTVGCFQCYQNFEQEILSILESEEKLQLNEGTLKSFSHNGKMPKGKDTFQISERLRILNKQLAAALEYENFEKAAFLRDAIKDLTKDSSYD